MKHIIKKLFFPQKPKDTLITVSLSKENLLHNLDEFHSLNGCIAPVLKSNAYGHGLLPVASILETASVPFFVIDSYFEAHTLRYNDIKKPLLIIGYTFPHIIKTNKLPEVSFTITSLDMLKQFADTTSDVSIHLKVDTGMHRQGILPNEYKEAFEIIKSNSKIHFDGICTHLFDADTSNSAHTKKQITLWNSIVEKAQEQFPHLRHIHIANTAGHQFLNTAISNVSRLGIGLYGLSSGGEVDQRLSTKPVLRMDTIVTSVKQISKDDVVGYGGTFVAKKDMTIATIPTGYFEGVDRRLSDKGFVYIDNTACPIVGRVSMNITIIDVSAKENILVGQVVNVISNDKKAKNSIDHMAKICKTIPYVIAVHIPAHLKRTITV